MTWGAISQAKPVGSRFSERPASDSKKMRWNDRRSQLKLTSGLHMQVHTHLHVPPTHVPLYTHHIHKSEVLGEELAHESTE